ncbi:MAG: ABC transporter substrate-binding protein [Verrucomicrobiia bacterium]
MLGPQRVLSLCTSVTDTMLRLGQGARLAGIDEYSRAVPGAAHLPVLGKGSTISREEVLARGIDLAFVWWYQEQAAQTLADLRVPVVKVRCQRAREVPGVIRLVGAKLGCTNQAEALAQSAAARLACLESVCHTNAPRVYVELYSPFKTIGRDSYLNDLIELAGGRNIAADVAGSVLLSSERLLAADPQVVVLFDGFSTAEQFARRSGMKSLSAVQNQRVHVIDRHCLVAGAGFGDGVAVLSKLFRPPAHR